MKGDEVKACFFFPMRKAAAIANVDFAVTWLHGAVGVCGSIFLRHESPLTRATTGADEDVRATADREVGATLGSTSVGPAIDPPRFLLRLMQPLFFLFLHGPLGVG